MRMASATSYTKTLPSPILPVRALRDHGLDHFGRALIGHHHLDFDFGQQIDLIFHAPIDFLVAFLPPMAAHFRDGHAVDADAFERFLDVFEFMRLDNRFDFFHGCPWLTFRDYNLLRRAC